MTVPADRHRVRVRLPCTRAPVTGGGRASPAEGMPEVVEGSVGTGQDPFLLDEAPLGGQVQVAAPPQPAAR